jgi:hypothetical protein
VRGALPLVPVTDLVVKDASLVVSTQGRAFWILDDVGPLRQMTPEAAAADAWLFAPAPAYLFGGAVGGRDGGQNPPYGATIFYRLAREAKEKEEITLEILDPAGKVVRTFSNLKAEGGDEPPAGGGEEGGRFGPPAPRKLTAKAGLNRFTWDLRWPEATRFKGLLLWGGGLQGPRAVPGTYQVRLTAGGVPQVRSVEVRKDPRLATTLADYQQRFELHAKIRDELSAAHEAITTLRDVREQVKAVAARAKAAAADSAIAGASERIAARLTSIEEALYQTRNRSSQDMLNYPIRLNNKLSLLTDVVDGADARPTDQSVEVYRDLAARIDVQLAGVRQVLEVDLPAFNRLVHERDVPAVVPKSPKDAKTTPAIP